MTETPGNTQGIDIGREQIGAVYAKALFAATEPSGNLLDVLNEFESLVTDVLDRLPDLEAVLASPRVSVDHKIQILDRAFPSGMSQHLLTFLKVVSRHERLDCLREICQSARHLYNEDKGLREVKVSSAEPIGSELAGLIENVLRGVLHSEITVEYNVNPALIGGMVVRAGDTVYDGSVVNHLEQLRSSALARSFQATIGVLDKFMAD